MKNTENRRNRSSRQNAGWDSKDQKITLFITVL